MSPPRIVLLFNNAAAPHLAARIHSSVCPMVTRMASRKGRRTPVQVCAADDDTIEDLNVRGFPVRRCKCVGGKT